MDANLDGADNFQNAVNRIAGLTEPKPTEPEPIVETEDKVETSQDDTEIEESRYTIKVDGEEIQVTLDELLKGNMMERDYRKKTSEVAELRKKAEAKIDELANKVEDADGLLTTELDYLESEEGLQLKEQDAESYWKKVDQVKTRAKKLKELQDAKMKLESERMQERLTREQELLISSVPDWLDEKVKEDDTRKMAKYMTDLGFTQEELSKITDHRMFVLARDAMRFRSIDSQDLSEKQVKRPPKTAKPGSGERKAQQTEADKKRSKVQKTGNMRDGADAIKAIMFK